MGYYTRFTLTVLEKDEDGELNEVDSSTHPEFETTKTYGGDVSIDELISESTDNMKWYDHRDDMLKLSKDLPDLVFILDGVGEENGDLWREFYKDGRTYRWEAPKVSPPEYNPKLLKGK